jgi:exosome complex exonuclease DIS3/RRP44
MSDSEVFTKAIIDALSSEAVINKLKSVISDPLNHELALLKESNKKLSDQIKTLQSSHETLQKNVDNLLRSNKEKDETIANLQQSIEALELKQDDQEQYNRRNSLRISGLPERDNENLMSRFLRMDRERLHLDLCETDIDRIHRVGKYIQNGHPRQVLIKFMSYRIRNMVFRARKNLLQPAEPEQEFDPEIQPDKQDDDAGTDDDDIPEDNPDQRLYINEDLTKRRSTLLWKARMQKKARKLTDCWSFDGRLYVKDYTSKVHSIVTENDLNQLTNFAR